MSVKDLVKSYEAEVEKLEELFKSELVKMCSVYEAEISKLSLELASERETKRCECGDTASEQPKSAPNMTVSDHYSG